ncbi:MAG: sulfotransferase [Betaproteobacteria bacterium]|nr:sulfotransferase [Betaproteobacteria bacterium]
MTAPVTRGFILGSRRSGSNLLRVMLNSSPHLCAPHPPHILHAFTPILDLYGDLDVDAHWNRLAEDVTRYANLSPVPLIDSGASLDPSAVAIRCQERSLPCLHDAVYTLSMLANGKRAWVCKSNDNIHYLEAIDDAFGDSARYLYLVRDGRDVALSFRKAPIGPKHPYVCAQEWDETQRRMLDWERQAGKRCLRVHYEQLLAAPEATLSRVCGFLGVPFHPDMLAFHTTGEAERTADKSVLWANLTRPLLSDNTAKWRRDSLDNVWQFERCAGDSLSHLGYSLACQPLSPPNPDELIRFQSEDRRLREEVRERVGADGGNRDQQAAFLARRRQELGLA